MYNVCKRNLDFIVKKKEEVLFLDQNIDTIPLVVVILGCLAGLIFLINALILVSSRTRGK